MIRVTITTILPRYVIDDEDASEMTDEEIVELCYEDIMDTVLASSQWKIERGVTV